MGFCGDACVMGRLVIVVDGGSSDGTCNWLAKQRDIFTIIQPNYKIINEEDIPVLAHSWGEFMNIGFRYASGKYILMVSDDLILEKGCILKGFDEMEQRSAAGEKVGSGSIFFREFPRHDYYRVGVLPGDNIALNHGFYLKEALEDVGYLDEKNYNFYFADSDVIMRIGMKGWKTIALESCFAEHLCHKPTFNKKKNYPLSHVCDEKMFNMKYSDIKQINKTIKIKEKVEINTFAFYRYALMNVLIGYCLRVYDMYVERKKYYDSH